MAILLEHFTHLNVDPMEFVETAPRATRGQPLEKLGKSIVLEVFGTVESHTLFSHGPC